MTELEELLYRSGHRPAKYGKAWICTECPQGKAPALKVDDEVYYCHRCQKGGNVVTLKRELGIEMQPTKKTALEIRLEQEIRLVVEVKLARIRAWQKRWRGYLIHRFRKAYDTELAARDHGRALLDAGLEVDQETIETAVSAASEKEYMEHWLNWFDGLSNLELIAEYEEFQRVMHEPIGRLETQRESQEPIEGERRGAEGDSGGIEATDFSDHSAPLPGPSAGAGAVRQE